MAQTAVCHPYAKPPETGDAIEHYSHIAALVGMGVALLALAYVLLLYLLARM